MVLLVLLEMVLVLCVSVVGGQGVEGPRRQREEGVLGSQASTSTAASDTSSGDNLPIPLAAIIVIACVEWVLFVAAAWWLCSYCGCCLPPGEESQVRFDVVVGVV